MFGALGALLREFAAEEEDRVRRKKKREKNTSKDKEIQWKRGWASL